MSNIRNAGRKPVLTDDIMRDIRNRVSQGESVSSLARRYGVTRQALYKRFRSEESSCSGCDETVMDYLVDGELCTRICYDPQHEAVRVINCTETLSKRAFGYNDAPDTEDLKHFLYEQSLRVYGVTDPDRFLMIEGAEDSGCCFRDAGDGKILRIAEGEVLPQFEFGRSERVIRRTDTDGFQMKAITHDRRHFVKSQAVIAGIPMRDWAVEVIASDICAQLGIPCIKQRPCRFIYEGKSFDAVYSDNFELDGYTFVSFERLLERRGKSSNDSEFISLGATDKMKWCAAELSDAGGIPYEQTLKYMLDLALTDILIGNIDRHTRNFGLLYNSGTGLYETALLFDNGMGLFENDRYRDTYSSFGEAMHNVYVSPYGEDPFDLVRMLEDEFDLTGLYPGLSTLTYPDILSTPFALEYERRILKLWQK